MKTVMVSAADISLFHVAQAQLGDATQWWRVAQLNGLSDPDLGWLSGPVTLALPATQAVTGVGLPELSA
jgi:hypothetical protein